MFDTAGNGICCDNGEGRYSILVDGDIVGSSNLGSSEPFDAVSHSFGICPAGVANGGSGQDCVDVAATILTDEYPSETLVTLVDEADGSRIWSRTFDDKETLYDDLSACIDPHGCYTFTVEDTFGDGLCCEHGNGSVSLVYDDETLVSDGDAEFGSSLSVPLGACA